MTDVLPFADYPLAAKLTSWGIAIHMGLLFGVANQIVLGMVAVGLISVVLRGYLMWWRRRPTRGSNWAVGRPIARGAWWRAPRQVLIAGAAVLLVVGWCVPLFGISLLGFLLIDAAVGAAKWVRSAG